MEIATFKKIDNANMSGVTATAVQGNIETDTGTVAVVKDSKNLTISGGNFTAVGGSIRRPDGLQTTKQYDKGRDRQSRAASRKGGNVNRYGSNTPYPMRNDGKISSRGSVRMIDVESQNIVEGFSPAHSIGRKNHRWGLKKVSISKEALPAPKVLEADRSTPPTQDLVELGGGESTLSIAD
ncbi:hypothetical protein C0989_006591 [Termitomyces sp. Mn162]|nr:hypothetical protein C0989_006591 [Termitomyces sp. Mn162]